MTERITRKDLEAVCRRINRMQGIEDDVKLYNRTEDGQNVATPRMYWIDGAYGGWALYRVASDGHGSEDVFRSGHQPARDLYNRMQAFIDGLTAE